jgi:5-enolpyruvylshikimate-3-phosphate synthase
VVEDVDCIATSYPTFLDTCRVLAGEGSVEVTDG